MAHRRAAAYLSGPPNFTGIGFEAGDYILKVAGRDFPNENDDASEFLGTIEAGAIVDVLVERNGRRFTIKAQCEDASELATTERNIIRALKMGDGAACVSAIQRILIQYGGELPYYLEFLRQTCLAVADPQSYQSNYVINAYNFARKTIQQAKYFPEQFEVYRANVLANIQYLEQSGNRLFAAELENMYVCALEFMERDSELASVAPVAGVFSGSCFFITPDGLALTNHHVIDGASEITVTMIDGSRHDASVAARSPSTDLAVVRIDEKSPAFLSLSKDSVRTGMSVSR